MAEENAPDPVAREKAKLFRNLNQLLTLGVLIALAWGILGYDFKTCASCDGIGKFIVACTWCDGDGKVSLWKAWRQAPRQSASAAPAAAPEKDWKKCPHALPKWSCKTCGGTR